MTDTADHKWDLIMKEYESLREEELNKMDKQYTIVSLGIGGIGVLLGIAFEKCVYSLFFILPLIILSSMSLFDAERGSIKNVGAYLRFVEEKVIAEDSLVDIMGWERWLEAGDGAGADPKRHDNGQRRKPYINFDCACLSILFVFYLACVYGIIALSGGQKTGLLFLGSSMVKYILAAIYVVVGFLAYSRYNQEFLEIL